MPHSPVKVWMDKKILQIFSESLQ